MAQPLRIFAQPTQILPPAPAGRAQSASAHADGPTHTSQDTLVRFDYGLRSTHNDASSSFADAYFLRVPEHYVGAHLPSMPRNIGDLCPISLEPVRLLQDAVLAEDGYIYDRRALFACLNLTPLSPMSRAPIPQTLREVLGEDVAVLAEQAQAQHEDDAVRAWRDNLEVNNLLREDRHVLMADIAANIRTQHLKLFSKTMLLFWNAVNLYRLQSPAFEVFKQPYDIRSYRILITPVGVSSGLCAISLVYTVVTLRSLYARRAGLNQPL